MLKVFYRKKHRSFGKNNFYVIKAVNQTNTVTAAYSDAYGFRWKSCYAVYTNGKLTYEAI